MLTPYDDLILRFNHPDSCNLFCICVDQYTRQVGEPFILFVRKSDTANDVREYLLMRLNGIKVQYHYGKNENREVTEEQKNAMIMYYVDYKQTRRQLIYDDFTMRELVKDDVYLDYKNGVSTLNIGIEL